MQYEIIPGTLVLTDSGAIEANITLANGEEDLATIGHAGTIDPLDCGAELHIELQRIVDAWADREAEMSQAEWHSELRADYYASVL